MNDIIISMNYLSSKIADTNDLFKRLGVKDNTLTEEQILFLNENGYLIIPPTSFVRKNLKKLNQITKKLINEEGSKGGWEGKEKYYKKGRSFETNCD